MSAKVFANDEIDPLVPLPVDSGHPVVFETGHGKLLAFVEDGRLVIVPFEAEREILVRPGKNEIQVKLYADTSKAT